MFRRIAGSWELAKASAAVLAADKALIVFPIVSAIATIIVTATFAIPVFLSGILDGMTSGQGTARILGVAVAFLFYLVRCSPLVHTGVSASSRLNSSARAPDTGRVIINSARCGW